MRVDPQALLAIVGMAVVTYATRAGGLLLLSRMDLPKRAERGLRYVPGAILVSIVVPTLLDGGVAEALAVIATVLVAARTGNLLLAMVAGVGAVLGLRFVL